MASKSSLTLYQKLVVYAAGSVAMLVMLGSFSYWKASQLMDQLNSVTMVQLPAARTTTLIDMYHDATRSAVLNSIVSAEIHDESGVQESVTEIGELKKLFNSGLDTLEKLPLHLETKAEIQKVRPALDAYVENGRQVIDLARQNNIKEAHNSLKGFNELFSSLEKSLDELAERVERDSEEEHKAGQEVLALTGMFTISGTLIAIILAIWILRNLVQSLKKFLAEIVQEGANLSETSQHLTSGSIELSESSVETANALEETSAAIEELNSIVKQNSENSEEAEALSKSSRVVAKEGEGKIKSMIDTIEHVAKSSKKMQQITGVIDDLAFQTNLLALNAAIEAARAGEHGRGFAVVAEAVRGLATRSALAAREINQHIDGSVQIIQQGSAMAADGRQSLLDIVSATEKMCDLNAMVAAGNREQVTGLTQISLAISQIDQGSQKNAAVAEELSASSSQLADQASHIHGLVQEFQRQVGVYSDKDLETQDASPKQKGKGQDQEPGPHSLAA